MDIADISAIEGVAILMLLAVLWVYLIAHRRYSKKYDSALAKLNSKKHKGRPVVPSSDDYDRYLVPVVEKQKILKLKTLLILFAIGAGTLLIESGYLLKILS